MGYEPYLFVMGDSKQDRILAEEEVSLSLERSKNQEELEALDSNVAIALDEINILKRAKVLTEVFRRTKSGIVSFRTNPTQSLRKSISKTLGISIEISKQLGENDLPDPIRIVVSDVILSDSNTFPRQAVQRVKDVAIDNSIDIDKLRKEFVKLNNTFRLLPTDTDPLSEADRQAFNEVLSTIEEVTELDALYNDISQAVTTSEIDYETRFGTAGADHENQKKQLNGRIQDLDNQLREVRENREKILFMSWIPDLTLRVGTVVLLLFLTQIILATYRYTVGLSAFYLARGDGLQLVQAATNYGTSYKMEELVILMVSYTQHT